MGKAGQDGLFEDTDTDFSTQTINGKLNEFSQYHILILSVKCYANFVKFVGF